MSKYNKSHLESDDLGYWGSTAGLVISCPNDNGGYGMIQKMVDKLELTDEEYLKIYGRRREWMNYPVNVPENKEELTQCLNY